MRVDSILIIAELKGRAALLSSDISDTSSTKGALYVSTSGGTFVSSDNRFTRCSSLYGGAAVYAKAEASDGNCKGLYFEDNYFAENSVLMAPGGILLLDCRFPVASHMLHSYNSIDDFAPSGVDAPLASGDYYNQSALAITPLGSPS